MRVGAGPPALTSRDVHVWKASLAGGAVPDLGEVLSPDERARAGRLKFDRDRRRFVSSRGILRTILGRYLGTAPAAIEFCYGPFGKPSLGPGGSRHRLRFNVSHAEDIALYAIALGREVGVDVERIRTGVPIDEPAGRFFSASERAVLASLPASDRTDAFFRCWTRKEAFIKAHGEGLSFPLDQFDVSFAPGESAAIIAIRRDPSEGARWSLHEIPAGPYHAAAIAVEGYLRRLWYGEWPDFHGSMLLRAPLWSRKTRRA